MTITAEARDHVEDEHGIPSEKVLSVSDIAGRIDEAFRHPDLQAAHVLGEVTNLREWRDHLFFSLIDEQAKLNVVLFNAGSIELENGDTILARGEIDFYRDEGKTSLKANTIFPVGKGEYYRKLQERKETLREDGYFEQGKEPPDVPETVSIIAGEDSDALNDVIDTLWERAPWVDIMFYPVSVQGESAGTEIEDAIRRADSDRSDTIIIARGGGDIEAFKPFNTTNIAKVIDATTTPVITGLGHRDDETIAGLTADTRAFTPTDAGKRASLTKETIERTIEDLESGLETAYRSFLEQKEHEQMLEDQRRQKQRYRAALIVTILLALIIGAILL